MKNDVYPERVMTNILNTGFDPIEIKKWLDCEPHEWKEGATATYSTEEDTVIVTPDHQCKKCQVPLSIWFVILRARAKAVKA